MIRRMDSSSFQIRREAPGDRQAVYLVNERAFGRPEEARLVDTIRANGKTLLSLVTELGGRVIAHVLFSPIEVRGESGSLHLGAALGPVGVLPEHQRQGVGDALIRAGLAELKMAGIPFAVVLGHPTYYPRFGFEASALYGISCQWEVPEDVFMALELTAGGLHDVSGVAYYVPEFEGV